jgi:hypothetical protein
VSVVSEPIRAAIVARARDLCEYCRLPQRGQVARFPVDHVLPRSSGGLTELANLALACPHCNGLKWAHQEWTDELSGNAVLLFNPRAQTWEDHFEWSAENPVVVLGKTATGRATVACLKMNDPDMLAIRLLLSELNLFPPA